MPRGNHERQQMILVIDSHKGSSSSEVPQNLHWRNAREIADFLGADLIWSYPTVNDNIRKGYDKIVFVHASGRGDVDRSWLDASPNAEIFYITNEYNLGEPSILWQPAKAGRHYTVIANHGPRPSKIVKRYTKAWNVVNLNALSFRPHAATPRLFKLSRSGCIYYGSFRRDRIKYFQKYLNNKFVIVSTFSDNVDKFRSAGVQPATFVPRIRWPEKGDGLSYFKYSLYLEDETTHQNYNFLANRFYEALNHRAIPVMTRECESTMERSGYHFPIVIDEPEMLESLPDVAIPQEWFTQAEGERSMALEQIKNIIHHHGH